MGKSFAVMSMCVISLTLTLGGAKPHQDGLPYSDANRWPNGDRPQAHLQGMIDCIMDWTQDND